MLQLKLGNSECKMHGNMEGAPTLITANFVSAPKKGGFLPTTEKKVFSSIVAH
jgi:hypothetical protein